MSSFVRKGGRRGRRGNVETSTLPEGTKTSTLNGSLLISTGLHDLDQILNGGYNIGTLILVEEDVHGAHFNNLWKYFLGEGITTNQRVCVASPGNDKDTIIRDFPYQSKKKISKKENDTDLRIAFQYKKYLDEDKNLGRSMVKKPQWCHDYNLSKSISGNEAVKANMEICEVDESSPLEEKCRAIYDFLLHEINELNSQFAETKKGIILRVGIKSLGSINWGRITKEDVFMI
eukprot:TRINITY_DN1618_c0_g3_i4.p1 TRINITY_DN1618_c0_g3~~TRINITY_DN1618_c0_g3_i4.p1  ORF type:complete len:232 (+),score=52.93 TRINITY_DN1618_c0_g3_i4:510-1205(+)